MTHPAPKQTAPRWRKAMASEQGGRAQISAVADNWTLVENFLNEIV